MHPLRWAISSTGRIAATFATALAQTPGARLVAVASRDAERGRAFAARFGAERVHVGAEALAGDDGVDAVYVASPHPMHRDDALPCLRAGKAVLCEKPLAMDERQVRQLQTAAANSGAFLMEALWTRCLPAWRQALAWLREGRIGEARWFTADFGFSAPFDPASRLYDPALGGGALLDVGIYCVAQAVAVMGASPVQVLAAGRKAPSGVDEIAGLLLRWDDGRLAQLACAVGLKTPHEAVIHGTLGRIRLPEFWRPRQAVVEIHGQPAQAHDLPFAGNGYVDETVEVARCVAAGLTESPLMPWADSLACARILDAARAQVGVRYASDGG